MMVDKATEQPFPRIPRGHVSSGWPSGKHGVFDRAMTVHFYCMPVKRNYKEEKNYIIIYLSKWWWAVSGSFLLAAES